MIDPAQIPREVRNAIMSARKKGKSNAEIAAAALSAWPGVVNGHTWQTRRREIILPLAHEKPNDR
jgi:hypothetical protein